MAEDVWYVCKQIDSIRVEIKKFIDDDFAQVYVVTNTTNCQCIGSIAHRTQCKHMRIVKTWISLGKPTGYFTSSKKGEIQHFVNHDIE